MWDSVLAWLIGAALLAAALIAINAILLISGLGNLQRILFLNRLRKMLAGIPGDVQLVCRGKEVVAMGYDRESNREKVVPLYTGILTWSDGPRLAKRVRRMATREASWRFAFFALGVAPISVVALWIGLRTDWVALIVPVGIAVHQFFPFYVWGYEGVSGLFSHH